MERHRHPLHDPRAPHYAQLREQLWEDFFVYSGSFGTLTATGGATPQVTQNIQVQNDADFEWLRTVAYQEARGFAVPLKDDSISQLTILISDAGSGRMLMDRALPLAMLAGTGRMPFLMPISRIFKGNSSITMTLTNLSAANIYDNVFVGLVGRKIFYKG